MWITIQSVVDTVYHLLNFSATGAFIVPSTACVHTIEAIAVCPIQMLKISAKAVLSKLYNLVHIQKQSLVLDDIEVQSFLNFLQSEPCYSKAIIHPICLYMKDVLILNENRVAFMQWNAPAIIFAIKDKHKDPTILSALDELIATLKKPAPSLSKSNIEEIPVFDVNSMWSCDAEPVDNFDHLTSNCYDSFDLFICAMKHFALHTRKVLDASVELTTFTVRSVTTTLGFVRDTMSINQDLGNKIVAFMAENSATCLSSIVEVINHWRGIYVCTLSCMYAYVCRACLVISYMYVCTYIYVSITAVWEKFGVKKFLADATYDEN